MLQSDNVHYLINNVIIKDRINIYYASKKVYGIQDKTFLWFFHFLRILKY